jgi:ribonuclease HI
MIMAYMNKENKVINIYTDGACSGNPGNGGWGAFLSDGKYSKEIYGGSKETTNNRMELTAAIESIRIIKNPSNIIINTDSVYVKDGITKWIANWKKNNWKNSQKKDVKNRDLWEELDNLIKDHEIEWKWVKGHAGNIGNERADELARKGASEQIE